MARRRRKNRRSATRNTASLLALALPAPLQRLANSPVGPLLMFFGLPAMLVAGLLQVDWQNGAPRLKVNQEKASELSQAVQDRLGNLPNHTAIENWQQTARDTWNAHVQNSPQPNYRQYPSQSPSTGSERFPVNSFPASDSPHGWSVPGGSPSSTSLPYATRPPVSGAVNPYTRAPFPSTRPPSYVSTDNNSQAAVNQTWGGQQQYQPQQYQQYQPQQYQPQQYQPQQYQPQQYQPQQPQYQQPQYQQPQYQQPQYQQPQYQQPQYQQPVQTPWQTR